MFRRIRTYNWANTLTSADLHAALTRAKKLSRASTLEDEIARLDHLDRDALIDAETLTEEAALDTAAADAAEEDAERLRQERLKTEADLAASDEQIATAAATAHEREAQEAREDAVEARRRRRLAEQAAAKGSRS